MRRRALDTRAETAFLVVIEHPNRAELARRYRIQEGTNAAIGRGGDCDVVLDAATVSRVHAAITYRGPDDVVLRDLDSANGTFRNRESVHGGEFQLNHGDVLAIGPDILLKFLLEEDEELAYHREVSQLLHRDALTGAWRSGSFLAQLETEFRRAVRYHRALSLILFDVDNFKSVNDRFGHAAGDTALIEIVSVCMRLVRTEQTVARLGGDEFAILCPETTAESALELAERLCRSVANHPFREANDCDVFNVTCSWGVAAVHEPCESASVLRDAADAALYVAKHRGRNCVGQPPNEGASAPS